MECRRDDFVWIYPVYQVTKNVLEVSGRVVAKRLSEGHEGNKGIGVNFPRWPA